MIINKTQGYCTLLFQINHLLAYRNFLSLSLSPSNYIFLKTEFQDIEVWFLDQNGEPLEIEDRINLTMVIK